MRPIALLCLLFGFGGLAIYDGQTYTHAVVGLVCGVVAAACATISALGDPPNRWEGWIMAGLGVCLAAWCIIQLPSARSAQKHFNERREQIRQEKEKSANKPAAGNAGSAPGLAIEHPWPGVPEPGRWT